MLTKPLAIEIRVRGRVQGVGFRPHVCRIARELALSGEVMNDADGVLIRAVGPHNAVLSFLDRIVGEAPPLARVDAIEHADLATDQAPKGEFLVAQSRGGAARTQVAPDARVCAACADEVLSPSERRYRYPFTSCTHCGPRLSIVRGIPYDRVATSLAPFPLCQQCMREYNDVVDRRFHAESIACSVCGPTLRLVCLGSASSAPSASLDAIGQAQALIQAGEIVAIKGLGGYQLACDATREDALGSLRRSKQRDAKPFALMARDLEVIRRYAQLSREEERLLESPEGPIVLVRANGAHQLPELVASGHRTLGFMLPTTPLHVLLLRGMAQPLVMTSGNRADAPPVIDDAEVHTRLATIASHALVHDRAIENRIDDSVARVMDGRARLLRRARGYVPSELTLPEGFRGAPAVLAYGADLKAAFCLLRGASAILSAHQGDLSDVETSREYTRSHGLYSQLFTHTPDVLVADQHPDYASTRLASQRAKADGLPLLQVQHHHAHVAACLAENGWPLDGPAVLGVVLDGLGLGADGSLWGGEFLLADYRRSARIGTFKPVAMIGGDFASLEPWRNLYAQIMATTGWTDFSARCSSLPIYRRLSDKPRTVLDKMLQRGLNAPLASSCGRLFDAVSAAVELVFERQAYEGQAAALLESAADRALEAGEAAAYPFSSAILENGNLPCIDPHAMWSALFDDLCIKASAPQIAARFHLGLANAVAAMVLSLAGHGSTRRFQSVVLSGGCFQNRVLLEQTSNRLRAAGFSVLTHALVPMNDGGIALGQAAIAAARLS